MFVKASNKEGAVHFSVVDFIRRGDKSEPEQVLDLGVVSNANLSCEQAWYLIADNLIESDIEEQAKRGIVKDLAQWLPPLSVESLNKARADDLIQLKAINDGCSALSLGLPPKLSGKDPLMIIAMWLEAE